MTGLLLKLGPVCYPLTVYHLVPIPYFSLDFQKLTAWKEALYIIPLPYNHEFQEP